MKEEIPRGAAGLRSTEKKKKNKKWRPNEIIIPNFCISLCGDFSSFALRPRSRILEEPVCGGTGRGSCVAVRHRRRVWERDPETVKVNVAVGGGSRANVKTAGESFSHEITNCQHYYNIIRALQEGRLFALQSLGGLGGRGRICE